MVKFKIKHLLCFTTVVALCLSLQLGVYRSINAFENEIGNSNSTIHQTTIETYAKISDPNLALANIDQPTSVKISAMKTEASLLDLILFRRTIECRHTVSIAVLKQQYRTETSSYISSRSVPYTVVQKHEITGVARCTVGPFGYKHQKPSPSD